ncbi:MAG: hypothetical protein ACYS30_17490 [Planctomycetota bacterium]|jgi:hypothetical protein
MKKQYAIWFVVFSGVAVLVFASIETVKYCQSQPDNHNKNITQAPQIQPRPRIVVPKISNITFREIDTLYDRLDFSGCTTDLQKERRRRQFEQMIEANYIGRLVQWTGKVADVDRSIFGKELYVKFKHTEKSLISDVTVFFYQNQNINTLSNCKKVIGLLTKAESKW